MAKTHCGRPGAAPVVLMALGLLSALLAKASDSYDYTESRQFKKNLLTSKHRNNTFWIPGYIFKPPEKSHAPRRRPTWEENESEKDGIDEKTRTEQEKWEQEMQEISRNEREKWKRYQKVAPKESIVGEELKKGSDDDISRPHEGGIGNTKPATENTSLLPKGVLKQPTELVEVQNTENEASSTTSPLNNTVENMGKVETKTKSPFKAFQNSRWGMRAAGSHHVLKNEKQSDTEENNRYEETKVKFLLEGIQNGRWGMSANGPPPQFVEEITRKKKLGDHNEEARTEAPFKRHCKGRWRLSAKASPPQLNEKKSKETIALWNKEPQMITKSQYEGITNGGWETSTKKTPTKNLEEVSNPKGAGDNDYFQTKTKLPLDEIQNELLEMSANASPPQLKEQKSEKEIAQRNKEVQMITKLQYEGISNGRWGMSRKEPPPQFLEAISRRLIAKGNNEPDKKTKPVLESSIEITGQKDGEENNETKSAINIEGIRNGRWGMIANELPDELPLERLKEMSKQKDSQVNNESETKQKYRSAIGSARRRSRGSGLLDSEKLLGIQEYYAATASVINVPVKPQDSSNQINVLIPLYYYLPISRF